MALQVALTDSNVGIPAPPAYARIVAASIDVLAGKVQVAVNIYASAAAR